MLQRVYDADHITVDFSDTSDAYYTINDYVTNKTDGRLGNVVTVNDLKEAQLMLISAIYFKGQWTVRTRYCVVDTAIINFLMFEYILQIPFNRSDTRPEIFYDELGQPLGQVDMMYQVGPFAYTSIAALNGHVLELPYGLQKRLSMILILPKRGKQTEATISNVWKL